MSRISWLNPDDPVDHFPDTSLALTRPDGLLAAGGDLSSRRILAAYRQGIFPWYEEGQPILWWSPDPRAVLFPDELRVSRSLRKLLKRGQYEITFDQAFDTVIRRCAEPRDYGTSTWITRAMMDAYRELHRLGYAHSVEVRAEGDIVGGLYGIAMGKVFFGESMFSRISNGSKIALVHLVDRLKRDDFALIDCQVTSPHLRTLGSRSIPRSEFLSLVDRHCALVGPVGPWNEAAETPSLITARGSAPGS